MPWELNWLNENFICSWKKTQMCCYCLKEYFFYKNNEATASLLPRSYGLVIFCHLGTYWMGMGQRDMHWDFTGPHGWNGKVQEILHSFQGVFMNSTFLMFIWYFTDEEIVKKWKSYILML